MQADEDADEDEDEDETWEEDPVLTRPLVCNTHKGTGADEKRARTAGALYVASPCGVVLAMWELFGSESLSQVFLSLLTFLMWASELGLKLPLTGCYDDACHLLLFLLKRQHRSSRAFLLSLMDWSIDGFHFDNHK